MTLRALISFLNTCMLPYLYNFLWPFIISCINWALYYWTIFSSDTFQFSFSRALFTLENRCEILQFLKNFPPVLSIYHSMCLPCPCVTYSCFYYRFCDFGIHQYWVYMNSLLEVKINVLGLVVRFYAKRFWFWQWILIRILENF